MITPAVDWGKGPALVLMHGTMMDHRMFEPQLELSDSARLLLFDLRARTAAGDEPYDLYDLAADCVTLLDELGIERAIIGGMSMGGFAALRVALRYPERVAGVVQIGSQASALCAEDQETWTEHYASQRGKALVDPDFAAAEAKLNFGATAKAEQASLVDRWITRFGECSGDAVYNEASSWLRQDDVTDEVRGIEAPTLIIHGEEDEAVPIAEGEKLERLIPAAKLVALPATGHAANLERPQEANRAIAELIRTVDVTTR